MDDNQRVKKGDLLVQLDQEPYRVQVGIKKAAVTATEADLAAAKAQVHGLLARVGAQRWKLETAIESVDDQVALLKVRVSALKSAEAAREIAAADLARSKFAAVATILVAVNLIAAVGFEPTAPTVHPTGVGMAAPRAKQAEEQSSMWQAEKLSHAHKGGTDRPDR